MVSNRRPTMGDVAAEAGVSLKTVSRVVNGVSTVDQAMVAKVNRAVERLGYRRNLVAAGLRAGAGTSMVGLITTDLSDPFFAAMANAVDGVARQQGFQVVMAGSDESPELERQVALSLIQRQVRGLIVVPAGDSLDFLVGEMARGLQVVVVDRPVAGLEADAVTVDNRGLGRRMAGLLVSRGHRRIAILTGSDTVYTHQQRYLGITERLAEEGVDVDEELVVHDVSEPMGAQGGAQRVLSLPDPPTAIVATNNRLTLGALGALANSPHRVELVAFDDPEYADILPLPVTLVAQDPVLLGRVAAERLFARLAGDESPARDIVVPTQVVIRGGGWASSLTRP